MDFAVTSESGCAKGSIENPVRRFLFTKRHRVHRVVSLSPILIGINDLNGAQRLNVWNDWNGLQYYGGTAGTSTFLRRVKLGN